MRLPTGRFAAVAVVPEAVEISPSNVELAVRPFTGAR
jgi:hypothetical protein